MLTDAADHGGEIGVTDRIGLEIGLELHAPKLPKTGNISSPTWGTTEKMFAGMSPGMGNNLRKLRMDRGWTLDRAATEMSVSRSGYIKLERGERKLNESTIERAARAFDVEPADVIESAQEITIVGLVGAGPTGGVTYATSDGGLGFAPRPPESGDRTVAVEVRGTSMRGIAEDGWLIYYDDESTPLTEDLIGELCVLWLADGQVVIKKPFHSRVPGLFDLESSTADTMREQKVERAALVSWIAPRRTARKVVRKAS